MDEVATATPGTFYYLQMSVVHPRVVSDVLSQEHKERSATDAYVNSEENA